MIFDRCLFLCCGWDLLSAIVKLPWAKKRKKNRRKIHKEALGNEQKERLIADFIAGMTDRYAINLHKKIE